MKFVCVFSFLLVAKGVFSSKRSKEIKGISLDERISQEMEISSFRGFCTKDREFSECITWGLKKVLQDDVKFFEDLEEPTGQVKVCSVSTGYHLGHDDLPLAGNFAVIGRNSGTYGSWKKDENGAGTAHAGVIAALGGNHKGVMGVISSSKSTKFQLAIVKGADTDGSTSDIEMISAVDKCVELGAKVISIPFIFERDTVKMKTAFKEYYKEKGVLLFAGAGMGGFAQYKYPASLDEVISVVPSDENNNIFSGNYNDQVELTAPGSEILTTANNQSTYEFWQGSGIAADFAAGVAGLIWMYFPLCTNLEIRSILQASALNLSFDGYDMYTGYGLVQAKRAYEILEKCGCEVCEFPSTENPLQTSSETISSTMTSSISSSHSLSSSSFTVTNTYSTKPTPKPVKKPTRKKKKTPSPTSFYLPTVTFSPTKKKDIGDNECKRDSDCLWPKKLCMDNKCQEGKPGDPCDSDNDCDNFCIDNLCSDGNKGDKCYTDDDCKWPNKLCAYNKCQKGAEGDNCKDEDDCDNFCVDNLCSDGNEGDKCYSDYDCGWPTDQCAYNKCQSGYEGDACEDEDDCKDYCVDNICSEGNAGDKCYSDNDCGWPAFLCSYNKCQEGEAGEDCESDNDCHSMSCVYNLCSEGNQGDDCMNDNDCSWPSNLCSYNKCQEGEAGDPCEYDSDCKDFCVEEVCSEGKLGDNCVNDNDCSWPTDKCAFNKCQQGEEGDPCEYDSDCDWPSDACVNNKCAE